MPISSISVILLLLLLFFFFYTSRQKSFLNYRKGTVADFDQMKELEIISYGQYQNLLEPDQFKILDSNLRNNLTLEKLLESSTPFVCEEYNKIVGMVFLVSHGNPTDIYDKDWCYIRMLAVHPEYSGKGIAKKLTLMSVDEAKAAGEKVIALHTSEFMDAARHIYESLGFTILKEIPPIFGKKYWIYIKNL